MEAAMAPNGADENDGRGLEPVPDPAEVVLTGTGQLGWAVGGKKPTGSKLTVVGGGIDVEGQFDKGQTVKVEVELEIGEVAFRDRKDQKTGQVTSSVRAHKGRIVGARLVES